MAEANDPRPWPTAVGRRAALTRALGLTVACPVTQGNPSDCQLATLRGLPMAERWEWLKGLSEEELETVIQRHVVCYRNKTGMEAPPLE